MLSVPIGYRQRGGCSLRAVPRVRQVFH
jgi:hypothetical protein